MRKAYWLFAYLGVMTPTAAIILGFRYDAGAPPGNYGFNAALYAAFIAVHLVMTRAWFKRIITGKTEGSLGERRLYIAVSVVTWVAMIWLHRPLPGPSWPSPFWLQYLGLCMVLLGVFAFFEQANFSMMNGFLGVPGSEMSHSHGAETPLKTEGSYASVRHPMYRAFIIVCFSSVVIHPNAAQLAWAVILSVTFLAFVPVEESQLIAARGEEYRAYMKRTPYRVIPRIW